MSRPELTIDWERVDYMLKCGCTGTELAATFSMHPNTFYRRAEEKYGVSFSEYSQQRRMVGDYALRQKQYEKAMGLTETGDNTLLIWLGKNRLGQRNEDKVTVVTQEQQQTLDQTMSMVDYLQSKKEQEDPSE